MTEPDKRTHPALGNRHGCEVGYKYFEFGNPLPGQRTTLTLQILDEAAPGKIEAWPGDPQQGGEQFGIVPVESRMVCDDCWREVTTLVSTM